jgi:hypothetical protein
MSGRRRPFFVAAGFPVDSASSCSPERGHAASKKADVDHDGRPNLSGRRAVLGLFAVVAKLVLLAELREVLVREPHRHSTAGHEVQEHAGRRMDESDDIVGADDLEPVVAGDGLREGLLLAWPELAESFELHVHPSDDTRSRRSAHEDVRLRALFIGSRLPSPRRP